MSVFLMLATSETVQNLHTNKKLYDFISAYFLTDFIMASAAKESKLVIQRSSPLHIYTLQVEVRSKYLGR